MKPKLQILMIIVMAAMLVSVAPVAHAVTIDTDGEDESYTSTIYGSDSLTKLGEGVLTLAPPTPNATGGTITTSGDYTIHKFTTTGTSTFTVLSDVIQCNVLVVGGGGGGAGGWEGSAGGGGGVQYHSSWQTTSSAPVSVVVGTGGTGGGGRSNGSNGGDSSFGTLIANGGGGGGNYGGGAGAVPGSGGSGGGAARGSTGASSNQSSIDGSISSGNKGGNGPGSNGQSAGGGGGAGSAGGTATFDNGGAGGDGIAYDISGTMTYYGGGGGGSGNSGIASGGLGGGGNGGNLGTGPTSGTVNTGGGGGGMRMDSSNPANGGSGIVIVRYDHNAINTYTGTTTIAGGFINFADGDIGTSGDIIFTGGGLQYATGNTQDVSSRIKNSTGAITIDTNTNNVTFASAIAGTNTGGLTKNGSGDLTLSAANSYSGITQVNGGKLILSSTGSIAGSTVIKVATGASLDATALAGGLTVGSGQTLKGSGTMEGDYTITDGGIIAPGNSPGTLVVEGDLLWDASGIYQWEINSKTGNKGADPGWDWVSVTGALTIEDDFVFDISLLNGVSLTEDDDFIVASAAGGISLAGTPIFKDHATGLVITTWGYQISGNDLILQYNGGGGQVPEPSTVAGILGMIIMGVARRIHRRRKVAIQKLATIRLT